MLTKSLLRQTDEERLEYFKKVMWEVPVGSEKWEKAAVILRFLAKKLLRKKEKKDE